MGGWEGKPGCAISTESKRGPIRETTGQYWVVGKLPKKRKRIVEWKERNIKLNLGSGRRRARWLVHVGGGPHRGGGKKKKHQLFEVTIDNAAVGETRKRLLRQKDTEMIRTSREGGR